MFERRFPVDAPKRLVIKAFELLGFELVKEKQYIPRKNGIPVSDYFAEELRKDLENAEIIICNELDITIETVLS